MRRILVSLSVLLLMLNIVTPVMARAAAEPVPQTLRFDHLTIEDGLSQNAVLATLQDSRGYLWIGTQDGLNRYDGIGFTVFRNESDNPASISHSSILALAEDRDGFLWIGTWGGGLNKYDPVANTFTSYRHEASRPGSLSDDTVTDLLLAHDGTLWVATLNGLNRLNSDGTFSQYQNDPSDPASLSANNLSCLLEDQAGSIWVGTGFISAGSGFNRMNADGTFTRFQHDPNDPASLSSDNISKLFMDKGGTLWVATGGYSVNGSGLDKLTADGAFIHFQNDPQNPDSLAMDNVMSVFQDASGLIWVGTLGGGLDLFDPALAQPRFVHMRSDPYDSRSLSTDMVWSISSDRSGVVWVGTLNGGLNKFTPRSAQFSLYNHRPNDPQSLGFNVIGGFYEDRDGGLWINTWGGGLDYFDRQTGKFQHYRHDPQNPASLISDTVMVTYQDNMGTFWVGSMNGLAKFERASGTFTPILHDPTNPDSIISDSISKIMDAGPGKVWIATLGGLDQYDYATGKFSHYPSNPDDPKTLSSNAIVSMFKDREGVFWFGTWGFGLNRLNADGTFTRFNHDPLNPKSLSEDSVWTIQQDSKGTLWVGTQIGLNRMEADGTFRAYHIKDGLPNETIMGILEDNSGNLWISTGNGLARFDPIRQTFKVFDVRDGLQSNEFDSSAYYKDREGRLYFGGIHGFNVFDPQNIRENSVAPAVVVNRFLVFNQPVQADLRGKTRLEVPYWQNFIAFEFAALDFQAPAKNQYAYKLEGFDADWVDAGARRYASYTNLPGGSYTFRVKAANSDGVWNEQGASIPLTVTPPVWETWWFRGLAGLLLAGLLAGGYTLRVRGIQAQKKDLETLVARRTEQLDLAQQELARHAEEELSVSEARFRAVFDSSAVGIGLMGLDRKIIEANPAMCSMLGLSAAELVGQTPALVTYPEDYPQSTRDFEDLLAGRIDHYWNERRYVRKNGEVFWASVTMSVVRDLNSMPRYLVGMVIDIDQQKRILADLQQSEARFRALHDYAEMGIVIANFEESPSADALEPVQFGKLITSQRFNPALLRMFGYSVDELSTISKQTSELIYPEDHGKDAVQFRELFMGQRDSYKIEKRYVRKDGSVFWGRLNYSLVRGANDTPRMAIGIIEDIDDEKRAQEKLRDSEARFRAMFDNAAVGMSLMTLERRVVSINQTTERILGYKLEELADRDASSLSYPEDREIGRENFAEMITGKMSGFQMEKRFVRKDGSVFWGRVTYSVVPGIDGKPEYLIGLIEDISEQRNAREKMARQEQEYRAQLEERVNERTYELAEANLRLLDEIEQRKRVEEALAAKAADDAVAAERTRLARELHDAVTQTLFASSLIAEILPELWATDVDEAKKSTEELSQLTRGALAEMRTLLLELRPAALTQTRLSDLIRQLCEALIGRARLPINLTVEGDRSLPPEVQVALYRIAQESLNNVFKYARATQVNVSLYLTPAGVHLEICDNGIGFDMSVQKSTSLGLRIMRERAEAIGADLSISSKPGTGVCVDVDWIEKPDMKLSVFKK